MRIILLGDQAAAGKWLGLAKHQARLLLGQGPNLNRVLTPTSDVTIRIQTLTATDARITITAGGADYVCSFGLNDDGTSTNLWTGLTRAGVARRSGKSLFGQGITSVNNLMPIGDGQFLGGPLLAGSWSGLAQIITTTGGRPTGQAFAPWQEQPVTGIKALVYSGLVEGLDAAIHKRFSLAYYYAAPPQGYPTRPSIRMPAVVTTYDSGQSFAATQFYINFTEYSIYNGGGTDQAEFDPVGAVFFGDNTIAVMSYTHPSGFYLENGNASFVTPSLYGIHTLLSSDGGQTWSSHHTSYDSLGLILHDTTSFGDGKPLDGLGYFNNVCYIGGSSVIAVSGYFGAGSTRMLILRSDNFGQTFYVVTTDYPAMPPYYGGISPICEDSAAYVTPFRLVSEPGEGMQQLFRRTTDGGLTWQIYLFPAGVVSVLAGSIVVREKVVAPDPLPTGKVKADFAKLAVIWKKAPTADVPEPSFQIGLSDDGGATWRGGGIVSKDNSGSNIGIMDKKLPAFPGYPDLHKNGLTIP